LSAFNTACEIISIVDSEDREVLAPCEFDPVVISTVVRGAVGASSHCTNCSATPNSFSVALDNFDITRV
jgi:hypothetical protein